MGPEREILSSFHQISLKKETRFLHISNFEAYLDSDKIVFFFFNVPKALPGLCCLLEFFVTSLIAHFVIVKRVWSQSCLSLLTVLWRLDRYGYPCPWCGPYEGTVSSIPFTYSANLMKPSSVTKIRAERVGKKGIGQSHVFLGQRVTRPLLKSVY